MLRAAWVNLAPAQIEQGASTLTQQLVRSYFLSNERSWTRKLHEAVMAVALELHFSKADLDAGLHQRDLPRPRRRPRDPRLRAREPVLLRHGRSRSSTCTSSRCSWRSCAGLLLRSAPPSGPGARAAQPRARRRWPTAKLVSRRGRREGREAQARPLVDVAARAAQYRVPRLSCAASSPRLPDQGPDAAGLRIYTTLRPRAPRPRPSARSASAGARSTRRRTEGKLDGAVVVTSPHSGEVNAIVGGRSRLRRLQPRARCAPARSARWSSPFIYLTALESGRYNARKRGRRLADRREARQRRRAGRRTTTTASRTARCR